MYKITNGLSNLEEFAGLIKLKQAIDSAFACDTKLGNAFCDSLELDSLHHALVTQGKLEIAIMFDEDSVFLPINYYIFPKSDVRLLLVCWMAPDEQVATRFKTVLTQHCSFTNVIGIDGVKDAAFAAFETGFKPVK